MSQLFLVRHGQASFLEPDYDKLSAKGETQSRLLGAYWSNHHITFDAVYSGPRRRQRETARIAGEQYRQTGLPWPEFQILDEFDEFRAEAVMERSLPQLVETDEQVRILHQDFQNAAGKAERFKTFQRVFEVVVGRWVRGELPVAGVEPWTDFCARVRQGLKAVAGNGTRGQRIAVFSSGGPIGVAMQRALDLSPEAAFQSGSMMRNGAYSEFLFSGQRFTLSTYNAYPHLTDAELHTYR